MIRAALICAAFGLSPAWAGDIAFVTSQNADIVSVIDLKSGESLSETKVAGAPAPVAYDAAHGLAYVVSAKDGTLSALDEAGAIVWQRNLGEGAFGIAIAGDGGLFVTDWYGAKLMRLDPSLNPIWHVSTGRAPAGVAVSPDGSLVVTADRDDNQVSIFDAISGRKLRIVKVGSHPYAVAFHDGRLWTTDVQSDSVTVIEPISGHILGTVPTGSHPYGIAFVGGRGFVSDQYAGTVTVFDDQTLAPIKTLATGDYPEGIATLPDGSGVVVVHWESNTMATINAASLTVTREIALPDGPRAFGLFTGRQR